MNLNNFRTVKESNKQRQNAVTNLKRSREYRFSWKRESPRGDS